MDKLIGLGYDKDVVMKGILRCGFCHGKMDAVSNMVSNVVYYFDKSVKGGKDTKQVFQSLLLLLSFSVACLVCMVRRGKGGLSKEEAMWRLVMCDLHVDSASDIDVGDEVGVPDVEMEMETEVVKDDGMIGVEIEGEVWGNGVGFTWDEAKMQAAEIAFMNVKARMGQYPQKRQHSPSSAMYQT